MTSADRIDLPIPIYMRRFCQSICCKEIVRMISISLLVVFCCLIPSGMSDSLASNCDSGGNYTAGSELEKNLDRVLEYLVSNAARDGYSNYSYGKTPNKMYGLLQCRGDVSQGDCSNCSQEAQKTVRQKCPNQVGGEVWFDDCFLNYNHQNFFSKLDTGFVVYYWSHLNNTDPSTFNKALAKLLDTLSSKATLPASKGFASGSTRYSAFNTIYAMVQCLRDLSSDDCETCLSDAIGRIPVCCDGKQGGRVLFTSCGIRFEAYPFVKISADSPLPSKAIAPSPTDPLPIDPSASRPKNRSHKLPIILGVVGAAILLLALAVCLFKIQRQRGDNDTADMNHNVSELLPPQEEQILILDLQTLIIATKDFHSDNKLGEGGFGPVYKGRMPDGRRIAVKKLSVRSGQGTREFMNEVKIVAKIQHRNLVKLLGCCAEGTEKLLVYEFMSNSSLDNILFG